MASLDTSCKMFLWSCCLILYNTFLSSVIQTDAVFCNADGHFSVYLLCVFFHIFYVCAEITWLIGYTGYIEKYEIFMFLQKCCVSVTFSNRSKHSCSICSY